MTTVWFMNIIWLGGNDKIPVFFVFFFLTHVFQSHHCIAQVASHRQYAVLLVLPIQVFLEVTEE